jgi:hypothetical protein
MEGGASANKAPASYPPVSPVFVMPARKRVFAPDVAGFHVLLGN